MNEKLFYNIIDQLAKMKFNGNLNLHQYNEPLLDKRLETFVRYIKKKSIPPKMKQTYVRFILVTERLFGRIIISFDFIFSMKKN